MVCWKANCAWFYSLPWSTQAADCRCFILVNMKWQILGTGDPDILYDRYVVVYGDPTLTHNAPMLSRTRQLLWRSLVVAVVTFTTFALRAHRHLYWSIHDCTLLYFYVCVPVHELHKFYTGADALLVYMRCHGLRLWRVGFYDEADLNIQAARAVEFACVIEVRFIWCNCSFKCMPRLTPEKYARIWHCYFLFDGHDNVSQIWISLCLKICFLPAP